MSKCSSKYHISVVGSCVSRDMFNSIFVADYKNYFVLDAYFARTTIPALMGKPIPYDINIMEQEFNHLNFEYNYTECSKTMLSVLENNASDFLFLDFYADVYNGTYVYDDSYIKGSWKKIMKTESIDTSKIGKFYSFSSNPEEYFNVWTRAFDSFMEYAQIHLPNTKIIINGITANNKITEHREILSIQKPEIDIDKLNAYWQRLNAYCEEKYQLPVIRYEKEYTLDPDYFFGLKSQLVHFHKNYYDDAFQKVLDLAREILPLEEKRITPHYTGINMIRNSNFEKGLACWSFSNSEWEVVNDGQKNVLVPCHVEVDSQWKWIWCDPLELSNDGKTPYVLSFTLKVKNPVQGKALPVFGIRAFKKEIQKKANDSVQSIAVSIPAEEIVYNEEFRYSYVFYPEAKFVRIAPHIKSNIYDIEFSDIKLEKGETATAYAVAREDKDGPYFKVSDIDKV